MASQQPLQLESRNGIHLYKCHLSHQFRSALYLRVRRLRSYRQNLRSICNVLATPDLLHRRMQPHALHRPRNRRRPAVRPQEIVTARTDRYGHRIPPQRRVSRRRIRPARQRRTRIPYHETHRITIGSDGHRRSKRRGFP